MTALTSFFAACGAGTIPSSEGGLGALRRPQKRDTFPRTFTRITHAEAHGAIPFTKVTSASQVPHRCINPERLLKRQITSLIRREVRPPDSIARVSFTSSFIRYHNSLWASILSRFSCAMGKRDKNREKPAARHRMPRNFVPALVRDRRRWYNKIKKIGHVVRKE